MNVIQTLPTPWTPYSVTYSQDGRLLAVGGGTWYGDGGILLVSTDDFEVSDNRFAQMPGCSTGFGPPTASGITFSADGRHLA
ncbi:MAG: hypothetical protein MI747_11010, partial [Desulfobacterales bacterium]|nr:hypothetical protein [Desulfobacterales bacterium]